MLHKAKRNRISLFVLLVLAIPNLYAQLSPGDLVQPHAHLEGLSNCTKCHILGEKVSNDKCLDCHKEIKLRIDKRKGYHSSTDVRGKDCYKCHSDHHGRKFEIIRFDQETFNHSLTGYKLEGAHARENCKNCHKPAFITDKTVLEKKYTYLGLDIACLNCHTDYHQNTLPSNCASCHDFEAFRPASYFNHDKTDYKLLGRHKEIECLDCHKKEIVNGQEIQKFSGIQFNNCTSCHKDIHNNKFGQNCKKCHSETSFHQIIGLGNFNHNLTNYKLEGKHQNVDCRKCHKSKYTDPIRYKKCTDCHYDYHKKQFVSQGRVTDCSTCHTTKGFSGSLYTLEQHNNSNFKLEGAHLATPCFECHKKENKWSFREIGIECVDCHTNIHESYLNSKYYPEANCKTCHTNTRWNEIKFDHSITRFKLEGAHERQLCSSCHSIKDQNDHVYQKFTGLSSRCSDCHNDVHYSQFSKSGDTKCQKCHDSHNWRANKFDHDNTRFKLDGKHKEVACAQCHKPVVTDQIKYVQYKFKDISCKACH